MNSFPKQTPFLSENKPEFDYSIESLGQRFPNEQERHAFFRHQLNVWLHDPALSQREDFPQGTIDAILHLSDPPYYTACPNPFLHDTVKQWQTERPVTQEERLVGPCIDLPVSTKTDKSYTLHTYHSKIPATTLEHLIDHFCVAGDVVLDCFCGSGVTGVACANVTARGKTVRAVLLDLSPAATFITYNYLFPVEPAQLQADGNALLSQLAPLYQSLYHDERGAFEYTIYSDVFTCANCAESVTFWDGVLDVAAMQLKSNFYCTHCGAQMTKGSQSRRQASWYDSLLQGIVTQAQQVPVARKYGRELRILLPDERQQAAESRAVASRADVPVIPWPAGANLSQPKRSHGISHMHHLFTPRNLTALAHLWQAAGNYASQRQLRFAMTAFMLKTGSRLHNIGFKRGGINLAGQLPNTYYLPNLSAERHIGQLFADKLKGLAAFYAGTTALNQHQPTTVISTGSATRLDLPDNSIDYCLTDPPFGGFVHYGELNFVWEAWLGVMANRTTEAIVHEPDGKDYTAYHALMTRSFREIYRVLKPGKWLTLVFHNSKNVVWSIIQEALFQAGFIVADVRAATRGQGSYKQMTSAIAIQTDLLVSAYKPADLVEQQAKLEAGSTEGVWEFVRAHLQQLPVFVASAGKAELLSERQNYLLFDRMIAFHVQRGLTVPMSAAEFYQGLLQRFPEREGMYFLPEQAAEYDRLRMTVSEVLQLSLIITDESSAIQWLKQQLLKKPQTFQELHPQFMRELGGWQKHEKSLELLDLLEENFLRYDGKGDVPNAIHGYLSSNYKELRNRAKDDAELQAKAKDRWYVPDPNKATDLEKLRDKTLLREFEEHRTTKQKQLKVFRLEAVRAGFKKAWQDRNYATIVAVAEKIPESVLQEDAKLLMWYDQALTRTGQ